MGSIRRRTWVWHFDRPPEDIWPLMADTARFNEAAALPKHEIEEIPQADGSVLYLGRLKRGPVTLEWQEKPVNWVHAQWFEHCREFRNGPFKSLCATFELGGEGTGTRGAYTLAVQPANALGLAILAGGFFAKSARTFGKLAAEANEFALGRREEPFDHAVPELNPETGRRVDAERPRPGASAGRLPAACAGGGPLADPAAEAGARLAHRGADGDRAVPA